MTSANNRASSGVRNLRSIFETRETEQTVLPAASPTARGRSPHGANGDKDTARALSKVQTSFVSVEPSGQQQMAASDMTLLEGASGLHRASSAGRRRPSFCEDPETAQELKRIISNERDERRLSVDVKEAIPEQAIEATPAATPASKPREDQAMGFVGHTTSGRDEITLAQDSTPVHSPHRPVTAAEEGFAKMELGKPTYEAAEKGHGKKKSGEPTDEAAVSGDKASPPKTEKPRQLDDADDTPSAKPIMNGDSTATTELQKPGPSPTKSPKKTPANAASASKPRAISAKPTPKSAGNDTKAPAAPKTPLISKAPSSARTDSPKQSPQLPKPARDPTRKASRSSLTASTAASTARSKPGPDPSTSKPAPEASSKRSPPPKRSTTHPVDLPSHLTAPTAASAARREAAAVAQHTNAKPAPTSARAKAPASARPTPRTSLATATRPESRNSQPGARPPAQNNAHFLDRLTRPTAASARKIHDRPEPKSPPRRANSVLKKSAAPGHANGLAKAPAGTGSRPASAKSAAAGRAASRPQTAKSDEAKALPRPDHAALSAAHLGGDEGVGERDAGASDEPERVEAPMPNGSTAAEADADAENGLETPIPHTNGFGEGALEATPAFEREAIR